MPSAFGLMLATHCKRTEAVDLKGPLLAYIKSTYSDREAEDANDDLVALQQLRAEVSLASASATAPGMRDNLAK
jgi:programmed cell death 6-interacting protein